MENIRIECRGMYCILVIADTERFGLGEIVYQGTSFRECFEWIKRETGRTTLRMTGVMSGLAVDSNGEAFPALIDVLD